MKRKNLLVAVSIAALLAATPALADSYSTTSDGSAPSAAQPDRQDRGVTGEVKKGWEKTKDAVSNTTEKTKEAISNTTESAKSAMSQDVVKASLLPPDASATPAPIAIDKRMTAKGMIGKPVYNQKNERVATVEDVILDSEGHANMIVVKDSSFLGLGGKLAAFDYDSVIDRKKDGDLVMPITQKTIDNVAEFSYKPSDKPTVKVLPQDGFSMKKLMDGNLLDAQGKKVAAIDNVSLRDGRANLVIASYNRFLGLGGDKVALDFKPKELVKDAKNNVNLQLSQDEVQKFESFKATNK